MKFQIINRIDEVIKNGIKTNQPEEQYTKQALIVERTLPKHAEKDRIRKNIERGNDVTITIKDEYIYND